MVDLPLLMAKTESTRILISVLKQLEELKITETESRSNVIQRLINESELKKSTDKSQ